MKKILVPTDFSKPAMWALEMAIKIAKRARCPVLTIHEKPSEKDFESIVYATSMNENEKAFTELVKNTQELYQAKVHLVRINTPMNFIPFDQL